MQFLARILNCHRLRWNLIWRVLSEQLSEVRTINTIWWADVSSWSPTLVPPSHDLETPPHLDNNPDWHWDVYEPNETDKHKTPWKFNSKREILSLFTFLLVVTQKETYLNTKVYTIVEKAFEWLNERDFSFQWRKINESHEISIKEY